MSDNLGVYNAINAVQADLIKDGIGKDRTNQQQGFKFRSIDDCFNALSPLLAKHKLCVLPNILKRECVERQTRSGTAMFYVVLEVQFDFVSAEDGSKHEVKVFGEASDMGDKATAKAASMAYKTAVLQAFAIPTEGDNDPDANTSEPIVTPAPKVPLTTDANTAAHNTLRKSLAFYCGNDAAKQKEVLTQITAYTGKNGDFHAGVDSIDQISTALAGLAIKNLEALSKAKESPSGDTSGWGGLEGDPSVIPPAPEAPITKQALLDWLAADQGECKLPKNFVLANISKLSAEDQKVVTTALINRRRELSKK